MSVEQATAFIERLKSDEEFKKRVLDITALEERVKARMKFINAAGYDCTADEIQQVAEKRGWRDEPSRAPAPGAAIACSHIFVA